MSFNIISTQRLSQVDETVLRIILDSVSFFLHFSSVAMSEQQQRLADDLQQLSLGDKYKVLMKNIMKSINDLNTDTYGIRIDENYITPTDCTSGSVDIQETKRKREINDIHTTLDTLTKLVKKLNREITDNQHTTYRYLMCKKRNRENEEHKTRVKKLKKQEHDALIQSRRDYNDTINDDVSLQDLLAEGMKPDCCDLV